MKKYVVVETEKGNANFFDVTVDKKSIELFYGHDDMGWTPTYRGSLAASLQFRGDDVRVTFYDEGTEEEHSFAIDYSQFEMLAILYEAANRFWQSIPTEHKFYQEIENE